MTANLPLGINERENGPEMRLTVVSGIVTGDAPVSYWPDILTRSSFPLISKMTNYLAVVYFHIRVTHFAISFSHIPVSVSQEAVCFQHCKCALITLLYLPHGISHGDLLRV